MTDEKKDYIEVPCQNCKKVLLTRHKNDLSYVYCNSCINEFILTITGKSSLPKALQKGHIYVIATEVEIRDANDKQRDDGKVDIHFKATQTGKSVIQNEQGKKMPVKDTRSQSQKLRFQIINENNSDIEDQEYYEKMMVLLRHFWIPYVRDYLMQLKEKEDSGRL